MRLTQFKDSKDTTWDCKINLGKALLVNRSDFTEYIEQKIILSRFDRDTIQLLLTDQALMCAVIGVLVRDQSQDNLNIILGAGTADEQAANEDLFQRRFAERLEGQVIEDAKAAFVEALMDFFPAAKIALSTFVTKIAEYRTKIDSRLESTVTDLMDQKFDKILEQEMDNLKDSLSGKSLPSPAS